MLCAVWASWAVLAEQTGPPNNGAVNYFAALLFQVATWTTLQFWWLLVAVMIASLFFERALHSTLPFNAAPCCDGSNCSRIQRILWRQGCGWGECGLCGLGGAVRLRLPPGNGGAAGRVGAVAVWRWGGQPGGPLGLRPGNDGEGSNDGGVVD